jgi:hypothetical protein
MLALADGPGRSRWGLSCCFAGSSSRSLLQRRELTTMGLFLYSSEYSLMYERAAVADAFAKEVW